MKEFNYVPSGMTSFVENIWENSFKFKISKRAMMENNEDVITGRLQPCLEGFFKTYADAIYKDIGAAVKAYPKPHAGTGLEWESGADLAIWMGPLTKDEANLIDDYEKGAINLDGIPNKVGNGVIMQAKKEETGTIKYGQVRVFYEYAAIDYDKFQFHGLPGKLFMGYSFNEPQIKIYPFEFTGAVYQMATKKVKGAAKSITFSRAKKVTTVKPVTILQFIQSFLSGGIGTPILMLKDILGVQASKIIFGFPPDDPGGGLLRIVDSWLSKINLTLNQMEEQRQRENQRKKIRIKLIN